MRKLLLIALLPLAGCATNSGVVPIGGDTFFITKQAASGFSGVGNLKPEALREAYTYCATTKQKMETISMTEAQPPYIFGNFPRVELQFKCV
ncbi:hypothetical protein [Variovorax sp. PBL-E5]|uniref:hypothetical protein n=1 Tax=Variovorax sp. PBL-E5 TaxID=434014 RepID=UPI00131605F5|nr:hypothetical protein [Variovorax sp. PBL-E5]VTU37109.1 hypothetical protein E5CHR_04488 [Variovorax sp. PBL-E5]